jgi:hypothetical protein
LGRGFVGLSREVRLLRTVAAGWSELGRPLLFFYLFRRVAVGSVEKEKPLFEVFDENSDNRELLVGFLEWGSQVWEEMRPDPGGTRATVERCPDLSVAVVIELDGCVGARSAFEEGERDENGATEVGRFAAAFAPEYSAGNGRMVFKFER